MTNQSRPRIGLLGLMLELYDRACPDLRPAQERFAQQLAAKLGEYVEVTNGGIANTRAGVDGAMRRFADADVDLVVVVHYSYAPSLIAIQALNDCRWPLVLFNTQRKRGIGSDFSYQDVLENHGMHGQQDLANVLVRAGRSFGVVTGHWQDDDVLEELREWAVAAAAARRMRGTQIGLIGYPFQDMGDFGVDETAFMAQVGPHVQHVGLDELAGAAAEAPDADLQEIIAYDREHFDISPELSAEEHLNSARAEWALRTVVNARGLDALAMHYEVLGADPRFLALPFAAVTKLMTEGIGFGGEGDVTSAAAVTAMHYLTGRSTFTEMFCMDFEGGAILMSHFAEGNLHFAAGRPRLVRRDGWVGSGGVSGSLAFNFAAGPVTMLNLTIGAQGRPKLIAAGAEVPDYALGGGQTPHCKLQPDCELCTFLDSYLYYGGSHHVAVVEGNRLPLVEKFADIMGLELFII